MHVLRRRRLDPEDSIRWRGHPREVLLYRSRCRGKWDSRGREAPGNTESIDGRQ